MKRELWCVACMLALVTVAKSEAADPEQAAVGATAGGLEEITVTARRREEPIQSVPVAVSAVTGAELTAEGITDIVALGTKMPGLTIVPGNGAGRSQPLFAIRGLSQQELTILADPSVTTYMGDIVYARAQGINAAMFDIDRVEVLKGPQGTLFGRNTTGGAIVVHPAVPAKDNQAMGALTFGNLGTHMFEGMANLTLGDKVQLRLAGVTNQDDGYITDVITGRNVNDTNTQALRISLAAQPVEGLDTLFVYNRFVEDDGGTGTFIYQVNETKGSTGAYTTALCGAGPSFLGWGSCTQLIDDQRARGPRKVQSGAPVFTRIDTWDVANTTTYAINDAISIKNILGYRSVNNHNYEDTDGTPWPVLSIERIDEFTQWSEELQVLGSGEKLDWIAGVYWFNEEGENQGLSMTAQREPAPGNTDAYGVEPRPRGFPSWSNTNVEGDNTSKALFAQATWRFTDTWSATVGARYTMDEKKAVIKNHAGNQTGPTTCRFTVDADGDPATAEVNPGIAGCRLPLSEDFSEPTWNVSVEWKPTDAMLYYLAHRHGYRSGGFGARASTQAGLERTFDPETVDDIELGGKVDWTLGGRKALRTNLALYYSDYKDIQRLLTDPTTVPVTTVTTNAGKAEIKGAEFELTWWLTDALEVSGWYAYTDASFTEFTAPDGRDLSIYPFARAPENTAGAAIDYTLPLPASVGQVSVGASYWYTSEYSSNDDFIPQAMVDGYSLVNLRADWRNAFGGPLDLGFYVRNATDEDYTLEVLNLYTALGFDGRTPGEPRTYGLRLTFNFGR